MVIIVRVGGLRKKFYIYVNTPAGQTDRCLLAFSYHPNPERGGVPDVFPSMVPSPAFSRYSPTLEALPRGVGPR